MQPYVTLQKKKGKLSVIWPFDQTKRGSDKKITDTQLGLTYPWVLIFVYQLQNQNNFRFLVNRWH